MPILSERPVDKARLGDDTTKEAEEFLSIYLPIDILKDIR
jgi:hypothetical protein